jgi:hypothetical protein
MTQPLGAEEGVKDFRIFLANLNQKNITGIERGEGLRWKHGRIGKQRVPIPRGKNLGSLKRSVLKRSSSMGSVAFINSGALLK